MSQELIDLFKKQLPVDNAPAAVPPETVTKVAEMKRIPYDDDFDSEAFLRRLEPTT